MMMMMMTTIRTTTTKPTTYLIKRNAINTHGKAKEYFHAFLLWPSTQRTHTGTYRQRCKVDPKARLDAVDNSKILPLPGVGPWNDVVTNAPSKLLYTCTAVQLNMITGLVTITTQLEIYNNYMLSAQSACRPGASSSYNVGKELTEII